MDALQIIAIVAAALKAANDLGPIVIKTAENLKPFILQFIRGIMGRDLAPDEQASIEAQIDALSTQLQIPLPPEQGDDI